MNIYAAFRRADLLKTLKNMVPMHSHINTPAHMEVQELGGDECTIIVEQPKSSRIACRIARAFYRRCGGRGRRVRRERQRDELLGAR